MGIRASNTEACDFPPTRCTRSYLVASSPGSESPLLCRALWETGAAGAPKAYFDPIEMEELTARFASTSVRDYTLRLLRLRTSSNGAFGLDIDYGTFRDQILEQDLLGLLPRLRFLKIDRDDRLGQAIAFVRGQRAGSRESAKAGGEARFDAGRISTALQRIHGEEAAWERFFSREGIEPFRVRHEALDEDYAGTVQRVVDFLGVTPKRPLPPVAAARRDPRAEEWRRRYLEATRSRCRGLAVGASGSAP